MTKPVAIYSRFSTDSQDARSLEDQARRCRAFAEKQSWNVVAEEADAARSGASRHRPGLQRLLAQAKERHRPFDAILVDDLSRLSRDLGDTWGIVFGELAAAGVKVVDCTTGMASDQNGARLTFGALALVNDTFLQLVRTETHRGLEGRALAGFHTGGRCYGFTTVPEPNPPDPEHPRMVVQVELEEAKIVRRIFSEYAAGASLASIVNALNTEGVPAPQDGSTKKSSRGWGKNLLHVVLRNERYTGKVVWNRREWFRDPITKRRRYRERPESEWRIGSGPVIVDEVTWARVQARHRVNAQGPGQPGRRGHRVHLLSGKLRCGTCGSQMSVVAGRTKGDDFFSAFGCSARHAKGPAVCGNARNIGERTLNESLLAELAKYFASPGYERWLEEGLAAARRGRAKADGSELESAVKAQQARVDNLVEAVAKLGLDDTLVAKLNAERAKLLDAKRALASAAAKPAREERQVSVQQVAALLARVEEVARKRPEQAREALGAIVRSLTLTPTPEGYQATLSFQSSTAPLAGHQGGRFDVQSCGGRI